MKNVLCIKYYVVCMKIFALFAILNTCYLILATTPVEASALSLSLDPSVIEINALPPSNVSSSLTIQNKSDNQVTLQIRITPFKAKLENGALEYLNQQGSFIAKNVQVLDGGVPVEGITLGPSQQKNLTLNINIPQDTNISARPPATSSNQSQANQAGVAGEVGRDYYFSIIFISKSSLNSASNASLNQLGIASNVLLSVGPKETPNAILEEFSSDLFYESGPVPFTVRVKNKGIHFIKPKGEILIKNMFGQNIGKLDLMNVNILFDTIRAIPNTIYMQELRSQDNSKEKSNLNFQSPKVLWKEDFLLGFYTATFNITLSDEGPGFTKSIHFFAFPFQGLIVIVIVLISAIIIINRVRARMKK